MALPHRSPVRTPLTWLVLGLLALLVAGSGRAAADETERPPIRTLSDLASALDRLTERLKTLVELANRDPRHRVVEAYKAYTIDDFKKRSRDPDAKDLVKIVGDEDAQMEVRLEAFEALTSEKARSWDPDLVVERGQTKPRRQFCMKYVAPLVKDKDPHARDLGFKLLVAYFGKPVDPDIVGFKPREGNSSSWKKCYDAWIKFLRK